MSEPMDNGDDQPLAPHVRAALLAEGLEGGPSQDARARMAAKLATVVGVSAAALLGAKALSGAAVAGASAKTAAAVGAETAGKAVSGKAIAIVVGALAVGGGVGVTIGELHGRTVTTPEITVSATVRDAGLPPPDAAPLDAADDDAQRIDAAAPIDAAPAHAKSHRPDAGPTSDQLARERELIDVARSALRAGDTRLATKSLVEHELRYPAGALTEERRALLIEVAITTGDRAKAQALAADFRSAYPHSVFQARIDALLH